MPVGTLEPVHPDLEMGFQEIQTATKKTLALVELLLALSEKRDL